MTDLFRSTGLVPVAGTIDWLIRVRHERLFSAGFIPVESAIPWLAQSLARPRRARSGRERRVVALWPVNQRPPGTRPGRGGGLRLPGNGYIFRRATPSPKQTLLLLATDHPRVSGTLIVAS